MTMVEHKPDGPLPGVGVVGTPPRITLLTIVRALRRNAIDAGRIGSEEMKARVVKQIIAN